MKIFMYHLYSLLFCLSFSAQVHAYFVNAYTLQKTQPETDGSLILLGDCHKKNVPFGNMHANIMITYFKATHECKTPMTIFGETVQDKLLAPDKLDGSVLRRTQAWLDAQKNMHSIHYVKIDTHRALLQDLLSIYMHILERSDICTTIDKEQTHQPLQNCKSYKALTKWILTQPCPSIATIKNNILTLLNVLKNNWHVTIEQYDYLKHNAFVTQAYKSCVSSLEQLSEVLKPYSDQNTIADLFDHMTQTASTVFSEQVKNFFKHYLKAINEDLVELETLVQLPEILHKSGNAVVYAGAHHVRKIFKVLQAIASQTNLKILKKLALKKDSSNNPLPLDSSILQKLLINSFKNPDSMQTSS